MQIKTLQYYRSLLDNHDQSIYDELFRHWMHFESQFLLRKPHCSFTELIEAVHLDNPILFYINFYEVAYASSFLGLSVQGGYLYTKDEAKRYLEDCRLWGEQIMAKLPRIAPAEQALWLHDTILSNVRYSSSNGIRAHNLVGVVQDGAAVCEGISMAYKYLCDLADIPCTVISGTLDGTPHAWNMLWIGGGTSFVDVTNDIDGCGSFQRAHFLRRSSEMTGYDWNQTQIPVCRVYNADHPHLMAHTQQEFVEIVARHISHEQFTVQLLQPLSQQQLEQLIQLCTLRCPQLLSRTVSYSLPQRTVFIQKKSR